MNQKIKDLRQHFDDIQTYKTVQNIPIRSNIKKISISNDYHQFIGTTKTAYLRTFKETKNIKKKKIKKIFFSIYRIQTENDKPFIEYLLYKYPQKDKDICIFPFITPTKDKTIKEEINDMMIKTLKYGDLKWAYKGYIERKNNVYLLIKLTGEKQKLFSQRVLMRNTQWWWCLIDEICNKRHILNFPVHELVTNLFYNNPILIYLRDTQGYNLPIPRSLYYGSYAQLLPFYFVFGPKLSVKGRYGPYYYMGVYKKAIRYAAWAQDYKSHTHAGIKITDKHGKLLKGGIVRYAVFLGKLKVLLNHPQDPKDDILNKLYQKKFGFQLRLEDREGKWAKQYDSLYYGRAKMKEINTLWRLNAGYVTKNFDQQTPLTMHILDKNTLSLNWDPFYDKYYIE